MKKIFEDEFMDLQSEFVSLCLELVEGIADEIFIYLSIEKHSQMFNTFVKEKGTIKTLNQLPVDQSMIMPLLTMGTEDISKIRNLCEKYKKPIPHEMKMHYVVEGGRYHADYKYEPLSADPNWPGAGRVFLDWIEEERKATV